jgi:hypothetical protein
MPFAAKTVDRTIAEPGLEAAVETTTYGTRGFARMAIQSIAKLVGDVWKAVPVSADDPLPTAARGYRSATAIVVGTNQTPGRAVHVIATVAGLVKVRLADDTEVLFPVIEGVTILPVEAKTIVAAGTTATVTGYLNLA